MNPRRVLLVAVAVTAASVAGQEPIGAPAAVYEQWQTASIDGQRAGYVHVRVEPRLRDDGSTLYRGVRTLSLTLKRFGDIAKVEAITGADETADGRVRAVFMRQGLGKEVTLSLRGTVVDDRRLRVVADGKMKFEKEVPWSPDVVGVWGELRLPGQKELKPGDRFRYVIYEPIINAVVTVHGHAVGYEDVPIGPLKQKLLRVDISPEEIQGVTLPGASFWLDARYDLARSEQRMPGIGRMVLERSHREEALRPCVGPDLGIRQSIPLRQRLSDPHGAKAVVYRIALPGDKEPATAFARDARQEVGPVRGPAFDLTVRTVRQPPAEVPPGVRPADEYLDSNFFIASADERVREYARQAIGPATDDWDKARRIEQWVHRNMKSMNFSEAMAPADHVAKTLEGDCTEYAMLTAAMCRAVGVPARTAIGLVYVDAGGDRQPFLGFHMWAEVWVRGAWLGIDATLGRGGIGPGHLKVADHSWVGTRTMTPILPLMRVMIGEPTVDIIREVSAGQ